MFDRWPAPSIAVTVITVLPGPTGTFEIDQLVVPAAEPPAPPLVDHRTSLTPIPLSDATPSSWSTLDEVTYVAADVGDEIATEGGVVSSNNW